MKGRKTGLRVISWFLVVAMMIQTMSSDLMMIVANANPAEPEAVIDVTGETSVSDNAASDVLSEETMEEEEAEIVNETEGEIEPETEGEEEAEDLTVTSNMTLTENMTVKNLIITNSASVNLDEFDLHVLGNVDVQKGYLKLDRGRLDCQDFRIRSNGGFYMKRSESVLTIHGKFTFEADYQRQKLEDGIIELYGDFNGTNAYDGSHGVIGSATGSHVVKMCGNDKQTISVNDRLSYVFRLIEIDNHSKDGVIFDGGVPAKDIHINGCNVSAVVTNARAGWTLDKDEVISDDLSLIGGALDLNGHTLTIKGDFHQLSGVVNVNGGCLVVEGDYNIAYKKVSGDTITYLQSYGYLNMTNEKDEVHVGGNFVMASARSHINQLTKGKLYVAGDMTRLKKKSDDNLVNSDAFTLILCGTDIQTIDISGSNSVYYPVANLEVTNEGFEAIKFSKNGLCVAGKVDDHGHVMADALTVTGTTTFENNSYAGDLIFVSSSNYGLTYTLKSDLHIGGNLLARMPLYISKYKLTVDGNADFNPVSSSYTANTNLAMEDADGYMLVNGNLNFIGGLTKLSAGTIEVKGDIKADSIGYSTTGTHVTLLSGVNKQTISLSSSSRINKIVLENHSADGVYFPYGYVANAIEKNGCKITGAGLGEAGYTLTEDTVIDGDFCLAEGEMDLNGHTLTVTGDLLHTGGTLTINGGKLIVKGDYRIEIDVLDAEGNSTKKTSRGVLVMTKASDYIIVEKSFVWRSSVSEKEKLTAGTLELRGDVSIFSRYSYDFVMSGDFTIVLAGTEQQNVAFGNPFMYKELGIPCLKITNTSEQGIVVTTTDPVVVTKSIDDYGKCFQGDVLPYGNIVFPNKRFSGNLLASESGFIVSDVTIEGDVTATSSYGKLTIQNCYVIVEGTVSTTRSGSIIVGDNASLICKSNCEMSGIGLQMTGSKSYVRVDGDCRFSSGFSSSKGTLELKGDLFCSAISCSDNHTTIFSGTEKQTISLGDSECIFGIVRIENTSEEGIYATDGLNALNLTTNGCMIDFGQLGELGYTLTEDTVIDGGFVLGNGTMDLNGHTLTIKGDLVQNGGFMSINKGTLKVEGSYYIQDRQVNSKGTVVASRSKGYLTMVNPEDRVYVEKDFVMGTDFSESGRLTAGVLDVKGNVTQVVYNSKSNFATSGKFVLSLSGTGAQTVKADMPAMPANIAYATIANLDVTNESEAGVTFADTYIPVKGHINDHGNKIHGALRIVDTATFEGNVCSGDLYIADGREYLLENDLLVGGDLVLEYGSINLNGHQLHVKGDVILKNGFVHFYNYGYGVGYYGGYFTMKNANDYFLIDGGLEIYNSYMGSTTVSAGVLELKGNLTQKLLDANMKSSFVFGENHKTIFSGENEQVVNIENHSCGFGILELKNTSKEGVSFVGAPLNAKDFIPNNTYVEKPENGVWGYTLAEDTVIEGDFYIQAGEMNLNGHTLKVTGNLYLGAGSLVLNKGSLIVEQDLLIQMPVYDVNHVIVSLENSTGYIQMTDPLDSVLVKGNFLTTSVNNGKGMLTDGTMEIRGDFTQSGNSNSVFAATENHKFIFSGDKKQTITMSSANNVYLNHVEVTNTSEEGVAFAGNMVSVYGTFTDEAVKLTKDSKLYIKSLNMIKSPVCGGNVTMSEETVLDHDVIIEGDLSILRNLDLAGHSLTARNVTISNGVTAINEGQMSVLGSMSLTSGGLQMTNPNDNVCVERDFSTSSSLNKEGMLTDGILEIKGDFTQASSYGYYGYFYATENHKLILSGRTSATNRNLVQVVQVDNTAGVHFNKVELTRDETCYKFTPDIESISEEVVKSYRDISLPSKVMNVKVDETSAASVTLSWDAAPDGDSATGYEVYRDGVKIGATSRLVYTDNTVETDKTYIYTVYAFNAVRNLSEVSDSISAVTPSDTTAPSVPTGLRLKTRTGSSITIVWSPSSDDVAVAGYRIYRGGKVIDTVDRSVTSYRDGGLGTEETYIYQVVAFDAAGNESETSASIKCLVALPEIKSFEPVEYSTIGGGTTTLTVLFKNVGNAKGNKATFEYEIENASGEKEWKLINGTAYGQQDYDSDLLKASCNWDYRKLKAGDCNIRVTVTDLDGNAVSKEFVLVLDTEGPLATDDITGKSLNGSVQLDWAQSNSPDCIKYYVYRADTNDGTYKRVGEVQRNRFIDQDTVEGKTYHYYIVGVDKYNQVGEKSEIVSVLVTKDLESPTVKNISAANKRVNGIAEILVQGEDNRSVKEIQLEYKAVSADEWSWIGKASASNGKATIPWDTSSLEDGEYQLRAVAFDVSGNRSDLMVDTEGKEVELPDYCETTIVDNTGIEKINVTSVEAFPTYVTMRWANVPEEDFSYFAVEQKTGINQYKQVVKVETTLGAHVMGLNVKTDYTFRVVGYDDLGNRGVPSDDIKVRTTEDTQNPIIKEFGPAQNRYAQNIPLSIKVTDNVGVASLKLTYSQDKEEWKELAVLNNATTSSSETYTYAFNVSKLAEGNVYVRAYAYDIYGNESEYDGEPIYNTFVIDRTAPSPVQNVIAEGNSGYIGVTWDKAKENDVKGFRIWRMSEEDGLWKQIASDYETNIYYDTKVQRGVSYAYKIVAVDIAGNVGAFSEESFGQSLEDTMPPVVRSISPSSARVSGKARFTAYVTDNVAVEKVIFEYRQKNQADGFWTEFDSVSTSSSMVNATAQIDVSKFATANYELRVTAVDKKKNWSEPSVVAFTVDNKAPEAPVITGAGIGYGARLVWANCEESDFDHYEVLRKQEGDISYAVVSQTIENLFMEEGLSCEKNYIYKVRVYDKANNHSESNELMIRPTDEDKVAPVAETSETFSVREGAILALDGTESFDNVKIAKYEWDMGNGDIITGAVTEYTYPVKGSYHGKLTVTDAAGNQGTKEFDVLVRARTSAKVVFKVGGVAVKNRVSIGYASIVVENEIGEVENYKADCFGEVSMVLDTGVYNVSAYAPNFLPKQFTIEVGKGDEQIEELTLESGEVVTGTLTSRRLNLTEIQNLGVDIQDPNNWITYRYNLKYKEPDSPKEKSVTVTLRPNEPVHIPTPSGDRYVKLQKVGDADVLYDYNVVSYLKKMYCVNLAITNHAPAGAGFDIVNASAHLNLPSGLSLLDISKKQSLINDMGEIPAQTTKNTEWYIKADKEGSYSLSANFNGYLMPFLEPVSTKINATKPIEVSDKEDNTFTDSGFAVNPTNYIIRVISKSGVALKGAIVTLSSGGKKCQAITNNRGVAKMVVSRDEVRAFRLVVQKDDYPTYVNESYVINPSYSDSVKLYKEGEEHDPEKEDKTNPYSKYEIRLVAGSLDGADIIRNKQKINRLLDQNHTLNLYFDKEITKYELKLSNGSSRQAPGGNGFQSGKASGRSLSLTVNGSAFNSDGMLKLSVTGVDGKIVNYSLNVMIIKETLGSVIMTYDGEVVDLLVDPYVVYTYYKDSIISIACHKVSGYDWKPNSYLALVQGNKEIATSEAGWFYLKLREFSPRKTVYLVAYDENDKVISKTELKLQVQKVPDIPADLEFSLSDDDGIKLVIPPDMAILGGMEIDFELPKDALAYDVEITPSGTSVIFHPISGEKVIIPDKAKWEYGISGQLEANIDSLDFTGHILLHIKASGEWDAQTSIGPVPIVVDLKVSGEATADGSVVLHADPESKAKLEGAMTLALEFALDAYAGVGVKFASAGVYGKAGLNFDATVLPWNEQGLDKAVLSGELGLRAKLLCFSGSLGIFSGEVILYNRGTPSSEGLASGFYLTEEEIEAQLTNPANYTIEERGETYDRSYWLGYMATNGLGMMQYHAYEGAVPKTVASGDRVVMFFTDDDLSKEVQNGSSIVYSYTNDYGSFATPVKLSDSDCPQFGFDIYEGSDGTYIVWQETKESLQADVTLKEVADSVELHVAKVAADGTVTSLGTVTDNAVFEAEPQICQVGDRIYVTWYENNEGDIFGGNGSNTMKMATLTDGIWSESTVAIGLDQIKDLDLGAIGTTPCIALTQGSNIKVVNLTDKASSMITGGQNLQFGYVGSESSLIWYQNGSVYSASEVGNYTTPILRDAKMNADNYQYISDKNGNSTIVFTAGNDGRTNLFITDYDSASKRWSNVQQLFEQGYYVENVSGAYKDGELILTFNQIEAQLSKELLEQDTVPVKTNICSTKVLKMGHLEWKDLTFDQAEAIPGGEVELKLNLVNAGLKRISADQVNICVYDDQNNELIQVNATSDIEIGETITESLRLKLPYTLAANDYRVVVIAPNTYIAKDIAVGEADLKVSARAYDLAGGYEVEALIENLGIESSAARLVFFDKKNPDTILETRLLDEVHYGDCVEEIFMVPTEVYDASSVCTIGVRVEAVSDDINEKNNTAYAVLAEREVVVPVAVVYDYSLSGIEKQRTYIEMGDMVTLPDAPAVDGYQFLGWYNDDEKFDETQPVWDSIKLTAKYEKMSGSGNQDPEVKPGTQDKPGQGDPQPPAKAEVPAKNAKATVKGVVYKVTKSDAANGTVTVVKPAKKAASSVTIPDKVTIDGYQFKVTAIEKNACKKMSKLTKVTIGKNVTKIGASAFYGCKKLKSVTIKSTKIKSIGKNAFKGISAKAKVKVPSKSLKKYKKLLAKAGLPKTAKVRK